MFVSRVSITLVVMAAALGWIVADPFSGPRPLSAGQPLCPGDCNRDGEVTIDELVKAVTIVLETAPLESCADADGDGNGTVAVNDLVRAVNSALNGCEEDPENLIVFEHLNLQPEGIEYDANRDQFVVGSRTEGTIHTVALDGTLTVLVPEPGLAVTLGLDIDEARGRLLAAGSLNATNNLALGIYALTSGDVIDVVDLTTVAPDGAHLANDVVSDADGNAYVTDTQTPGIYRVDVEGTPSLFSDNALLAGANGIEIYDNSVLIVAPLNGPNLVRVPLDDPQAVSTIAVDIPMSGDGIVFAADGDLVVVGGLRNRNVILRLRSNDDWQSATIVGSFDITEVGAGAATTVARRADVIHAIFAHLFDQSRVQYEIARVVFEDATP